MKKPLAALLGLSSLLFAHAALADEPGWQTMPGAPPPLPADQQEPAPLPPPAAKPAAAQAPAPAPAPAPVATTTTTSAEVERTEKDSPEPLPPLENDQKTLKPMQIDLKMGLNTNPILSYIGFGLSADVGVAKTGPGTLAVGAGYEHSACATSCWGFESSTPYMDFSERQNWAQARATYHLGLASVQRLDLYPVVSMGPVFASSTVDLDGGATRYRGTRTTIGLGLGAGFSYTFYGPLFVGAEARIRYGAGSYDYRLINGREKSFDRASVDGFSLNGLDAFLAFGARLP